MKHWSYLDGHLIERPTHAHPFPERWVSLRAQVFAEQGGRCGTCPAEAQDLHHRHYNRFGDEERTDVIGLCRVCHDAITSRLRAYRYGAGQLSVTEIAEKVRGEKVERFRPAPLKTVDIPSPVNREAPDRFRPKLRTPFTPSKET